jgi:hypothetical protein
VNIEGSDYQISPKVWEVFDNWYGDKAYRQAEMVEALERAVRDVVREELRAMVEGF